MGRKAKGFRLEKFPWSPCWYIVGGGIRRKSTGREDYREAEEVLAKTILKVDHTSDEITVDEVLDDYLEEHTPSIASPETARHYAKGLKHHFGGLEVLRLTPSIFREFARDKKPGTVRRQLTVLIAALNHARKEGRIQSVPYIPLPSAPPPKERWLTRKEAKKLILACKLHHTRLFIALALFTGQRKGAILDLQWPQVDLTNRIIDFNPPGRIQTAKKRPSVPINDELARVLRQIPKPFRKGYVVAYRGKKRMGDIKRSFGDACDLAGLENVTPHTLRHTAGTWLAQAGVDMWRISGILGHSHSRTTELYAKHHSDYLHDAVGKLQLAHNLRTKKVKKAKRT